LDGIVLGFIELHHIPGKNNGQADALSRRPDYDQGERDNENVIVLPDDVFVNTGSTTSSHHAQPRTKTSYVPGLTHTSSRKSTENGGKGNEG
jgi:hypothetical protein